MVNFEANLPNLYGLISREISHFQIFPSNGKDIARAKNFASKLLCGLSLNHVTKN
jgi:hypothetical protein